MPLIDFHCHFGVTPSMLVVRPPQLDQALAYADQFGVETLCFATSEAATDLGGGTTRLSQALSTDRRFRGWLTLSVHQPDQSQALARHYLTRAQWIGARFEQQTDDDAIDVAGGHAVLNSLRRYGRPVLLTVNSQATLHAAIVAAREFHTMRFFVSPQNAALTTDIVPAIKEVLNISLLPSAAFTERDVLAQAVTTISERRIVWSSDWGRLHPAAALGMLQDSALTATQRERIAYRNAREILADIG
jgi:Amidohydrolase